MSETTHTTDTDCTLNAQDTCVECGVYHGDPCPDCGGRGYHGAECSEIAASHELCACCALDEQETPATQQVACEPDDYQSGPDTRSVWLCDECAAEHQHHEEQVRPEQKRVNPDPLAGLE